MRPLCLHTSVSRNLRCLSYIFLIEAGAAKTLINYMSSKFVVCVVMLPVSFFSCVLLLFATAASSADSDERYLPTWDSLDKRPLPTWYDEGKFGIFVHWAVYSEIGFGDWFWLNWIDRQSPVAVDYMQKMYKPRITYQDVAREFNAELFDPKEWALLFKNAGAKYVVLTTKHHEGFTLWPSKYSWSWNSVDVGPHRDIVGELAAAVREHTDLHFGLYYSLFEWYNRLYIQDRDNKFKTQHFVHAKSSPELRDLVNTYLPEVIWTDGEWEAHDDYWQAKDFLTWLYNESPVRDSVVVNDRWGMNTLCKHGGFLTCADRYNPKKKQNRKWENAMTVDRTWGYRKSANIEDFMSSAHLIKTLIETVSCGGNILMNVGPNGAGKIAPIYQERLLDVGRWLRINGEAIYRTHPWDFCQNDKVSADVWYTRGANSVLYAMFLKWPLDGKITMTCVKPLNGSVEVGFLGPETKLKSSVVNEMVEVILPNKAHVELDWAWTLRITGAALDIKDNSIDEEDADRLRMEDA